MEGRNWAAHPLWSLMWPLIQNKKFWIHSPDPGCAAGKGEAVSHHLCFCAGTSKFCSWGSPVLFAAFQEPRQMDPGNVGLKNSLRNGSCCWSLKFRSSLSCYVRFPLTVWVPGVLIGRMIPSLSEIEAGKASRDISSAAAQKGFANCCLTPCCSLRKPVPAPRYSSLGWDQLLCD